MNVSQVSSPPECTTSEVKRRVFVVEDHPICRAGLTALLNREADFTVCGEAEGIEAATGLILERGPDILVIDLSLNGGDGLEIIRDIRGREPDLPILVLSMHDELLYAEAALRAGANGYIMKQEATDFVLKALRQILEGDVYVSVRVASRILQQRRKQANVPGLHVASLSHREREVLRLMGEGRSTRQIALDLQLSVKTVETHQVHLKEKLGLVNSRELTQYAVQWYLKH